MLITHGPPTGVLDMTRDNGSVGCPKLREALGRVRPKLHVFGHIHETHGQQLLQESGTLCVNASICSYEYRPVQPAHVIDLQPYASSKISAGKGDDPISSELGGNWGTATD